jgi:uncharacterized membrane protein YoaK (UPF0700 family)
MTVETTIRPSSLSDAMFLACTGGLLDAFVFVNHGQVFANAMTGNVALLGVAVIGHDWRAVIPHLVPFLGFFAGVASARQIRSFGYATILALAFEVLVLFALGWAPASFPDMAFTGIVAYVAALQVATFRRVDDGFSFNSTFVTGNLRSTVEGFFDMLAPSSTPEARQKGRAEARDLGSICTCFLGGAVLGAWAAPRFTNHTLWLAEPLLLFVAVRLLRWSNWSTRSTHTSADRTPGAQEN